ncbi:PolC-type DNA polymerase III [Telluribacter sp. SYSU D00476]|uniref:3'-5' exonuclease n=1 Tax=Telluribacter sp. SYSU D00476 TaxID=2811430 RepID=UPI001FF41D12|nr:3'-5' exonuclease [Telluribacter sp. SYSU D00476]
MYCIVDIETTGGVKGPTRIIEVAIYRHDGQQVVDSFHSLVNPLTSIPPFISRLTGIDDKMVQDAPLFAEIADSVRSITEDAWFVAHNVQFDYNFVKKEFLWLDEHFHREQLCTIRLSRRLLPGYKSYSLGNLCQSLDIELNDRHRASGDAAATVTLFEMLLQHDNQSLIPKNTEPTFYP